MNTKYWFSVLAGMLMLMCPRAHAQIFTVGSTGMSVQLGTILYVDSLVLVPSAALSLTSVSLGQSAAPVSVNGNAGIDNVFTFSTPVTYSGTVALGYTTAELNGNTASALVIAYDSSSSSRYALSCASVTDTVARTVTSATLSGAPLYNITAVKSTVSVPAAITGGSSVYVGGTDTLTDATTGGTWSSTSTSLATVSSAGVITGVTAGTDTIQYSVTNTCNTATQLFPVNVIANGSWIGITSTDWGNSTNWAAGIVPTASVSVSIPSGTPYSPEVISGSYSTNGMSVSTGALVTIDSPAILNVNGSLANNGTFTGKGSLLLTGAAAQAISGTGTYYNVGLNNNAGAAIASGTASVKGTLSLTSGTLTTNGFLTLASDSAGTGRIGPVPASGADITGNVKCQQYIPGGRRAYRFFGHPFSSAITLQPLEDSIDITGHLGAANGFTTTGTNNPSAYWYRTLTGNGSAINDSTGWRAFTAITDPWNQYEGIRVLVRGPKGEGLDGLPYTPSPATIALTGQVNKGSLDVTLVMGDSSKYNLLGNPYPSPVDIGTVISNASAGGNIYGSAFWVWDAQSAVKGAYVPVPIGYASDYNYLPANTAYEVKAAYNGAMLHFDESNKVSTYTHGLLRSTSGPRPFVTLHLFDSASRPWDVTYISFNNAATDTLDSMLDAKKAINSDLNLYSLTPDSRHLSVDARPFTNGGVIPLGLVTAARQQFTFKTEECVLPADGSIYLHDKYLGIFQELSPGVQYTFSVTADSLSQGTGRFELNMVSTPAVSAVAAVNADEAHMLLTPNPATDNTAITYSFAGAGAKALRLITIKGEIVMAKNLGTAKTGTVHLSLSGLTPAIYLLEIKCGGVTKTQRLVKE